MSNSRTKNTMRNIFAGLFNKMVMIILPFINRTVILSTLGAEFTGLAGLFASILQVLNLAELGFNTAIVYSLYKPMSDKNERKICETVALYKKIYTIVGTVVLAGGILVLPFIKYLIKGGYPSSINIYALYLLYLINSAISYYLFAYKECLLIADQRKDIASNIRTIVEIIRYLVQLFILMVTKNFYLYLVAAILGTIVTNICIEISTRKRYPYVKKINVKMHLPSALKKQVGGLLINRICDTFRNSFDSLIISAFLGLIATTIYGNYYYIYSALYGIMLVVCNSMSASVGNSIIKKSEEDNYRDMRIFYHLFTWILGISTVCLGCLYQPFMKLWVGDKLLLPNYDAILFCVYFYVININNIRNQYVSGTGIWWHLKKSYIIEAVANLVLNVCLGKLFGITGVILATIITIFLFNYLQRNAVLFKKYFKRERILLFYKEQFYYMIIVSLGFLLSYIACSYITTFSISSLLLKGLVALTITMVVLYIGLKWMTIYKDARSFVQNNIIKKTKKFVRKEV